MNRDPIPPLPPSPPLILPMHSLLAARGLLSPADFRLRLRKTMLSNPNLTLLQVARALGVTRQCVGGLVGRLDRPTGKPAIKTEKAREKLAELCSRVAAGESAVQAAKELGIRLAQVYASGFRAHGVKPMHGGGKKDCNCYRCRCAAGIARRRSPRMRPERLGTVLDLLAWRDPDDNTSLTQVTIGRMANCSQGTVSRIARSAQ
jgi:hypothetical protein